jgi:hypothetical protein
MTVIMRSESRRKRRINAKGTKRLAMPTTTLKAAIAVIIQATRMMRIHDLQNGGSFPSHLPAMY